MAPKIMHGKVNNFLSRNGFGFIQPKGTTEKSDEIFVHWKQINTSESWPKLEKGMEVQFSVEEIEGKKQAVNVSAKGGKKIVNEQETKNHSSTTYSGKIEFFNRKGGYGFIKADDEDIEHDGKKIEEKDGKKSLYFTREDINMDDDTNTNYIRDDTQVTFSVYTVAAKDGLCAGKIQMPVKDYADSDLLTGKVKFFDWKKGFGFITPEDNELEYNGEKLEEGEGLYFTREDITPADGYRHIKDNMDVKFHAYILAGKKGLSAGHIVGEDGEPIVRSEEDKEKAMKRKAKWEEKNSNKKAKKN